MLAYVTNIGLFIFLTEIPLGVHVLPHHHQPLFILILWHSVAHLPRSHLQGSLTVWTRATAVGSDRFTTGRGLIGTHAIFYKAFSSCVYRLTDLLQAPSLFINAFNDASWHIFKLYGLVDWGFSWLMMEVKDTPSSKTLGDPSDIRRKMSAKSPSIITPQKYVIFISIPNSCNC